MNILVTGAGGQLGNEMQIVSKGSADKYFFTDICEGYGQLDITDLEAVKEYVGRNGIEVIVNCAAWTNVDGAEDPAKYDLVEKLNATAPENLAKAMKESGGLLVHISTDYIFGGKTYNTPYKEDRTAAPTTVYGLTKLHGEQAIQRVFEASPAGDGAYVIIRTSWLYSEFGRNFCKTMLNLTATKPELKVVFDQVGTPTYALDLAKAIVVIIEDYVRHVGSDPVSEYPRSGIYHFSNEGVCSWYDFAQMIQLFSGQTACEVQPCRSFEFPTTAERPAFSVLDKTRIKDTFGIGIPYWTDSLKKCIGSIMRLALKEIP